MGLKLFVWIKEDKVVYDTEVPRGITIDTAVIFKITREELIHLDESKIIVRKI